MLCLMIVFWCTLLSICQAVHIDIVRKPSFKFNGLKVSGIFVSKAYSGWLTLVGSDNERYVVFYKGQESKRNFSFRLVSILSSIPTMGKGNERISSLVF